MQNRPKKSESRWGQGERAVMSRDQSARFKLAVASYAKIFAFPNTMHLCKHQALANNSLSELSLFSAMESYCIH